MNKSLFLVFVLAVQPIAAAPGEPVMELSGYISSWTQECPAGTCSLPKPGERNRPVQIRLAMPSAPGEASAARSEQALGTDGGAELRAELGFFAICPYGGAPDACQGRYFQAQIVLSGPAEAFCAAALNAGDIAPFPVLMCAGSAQGGRRFGVTLHRQVLQ